MTPDNPNYRVTRTDPTPEFAPDHTFVAPQHGALTPCWQELFQLDDGHIVRCGVHKRFHPPRIPRHVINVEDGP